MGNQIINKCRSRKQRLIAEEKEEQEYLEQEVYLKGSFKYLQKVGLNKSGQITDKQSPLLLRENIKKVLLLYCQENLDIDNVQSQINDQGIIQFGYFIRIYKTAFFWKKIFFEKQRVEYLERRRGFIFQKNFEMYKNVINLMEKVEERCLENVLKEIYQILEIKEESFQKSLKFHQKSEDKSQKIKFISDFAHSTPKIMHLNDFLDYDLELSPKESLRILDLFHQISVQQINQLKLSNNQDELYSDYLYLKYKIEDYFYLQTGLEKHDFKNQLEKIMRNCNKNKEDSYDSRQFLRDHKKMEEEYLDVIKEINNQIYEIFNFDILNQSLEATNDDNHEDKIEDSSEQNDFSEEGLNQIQKIY